MSAGIFNNVRIGNADLSSRPLSSDGDNPAAPRTGRAGRVKRTLLVGGLAVGVMLSMPTEAHAGIFGVFDAIFSLISGPIGSSLKEMNQITQETQKLYQQTVWPLAAINQARGFVSTSISGYRAGQSLRSASGIHSPPQFGPTSPPHNLTATTFNRAMSQSSTTSKPHTTLVIPERASRLPWSDNRKSNYPTLRSFKMQPG
jgi:hypothetical protein